MPQSVMPQIKNVVMLMLENRSLDNVLGYLYSGSAPKNIYPAGSSPNFNGVPSNANNPAFNWRGNVVNYPVTPVPVQWITQKGWDPSVIPWYDPTEEYVTSSGYGVTNQVFGNQNQVAVEPPFGTAPTMLGFLQDYYRSYMVAYQGLDVLWMFQNNLLPNLYAVAQSGAVSDAWFSSVPTQTNPNRAYSLVGTSMGRESNLSWTAVEQFPIPTLFNALSGAGKSWGLYYTDVWQNGQCYTAYTFPNLNQATSNGEIALLATFLSNAAKGTLPAFSFLEPTWGYGMGAIKHQGTDLHPPTSVTPGDQFVGQIVQALASSPQWPNTLLIITFDEHGGTYDHVGPAWGAINPDGLNGPSGFAFNRFGVRVPTILISPYVQANTVFRAPSGSQFPFDHTSIIKTLVMWAGLDPNSAGFYKRMPAAPTFDGVLTTSDSVASDTAAMITKKFRTLAAPPAPPAPAFDTPSAQPLNQLFDGVARASVRAIIASSNTIEEVVKKVEQYKRDPEAYEKSLAV